MKLDILSELEREYQKQEELRLEIISAYSKAAILEAKFKKLAVQYRHEARDTSEKNDKKATTKKATEIKNEVEHRLSLEPDYAEHISIPIRLEGLYRQLKIIECRLKTLERYAERQRRIPRL